MTELDQQQPKIDAGTSPSQEDLPTVATRAFGWSFLNTAVSRLGTLAIGIALARILGPEAFGTFAIAMVALLAMLSFNELGVSLAIVRWKNDPAGIIPTVNTISVVASSILVALVWITAPWFASAMGDPEAASVVRVMALSILINGAVATPAALLQREFRQRRRMAIDQVNTWLGAAVSLTLAFVGMGAMSLAVGRVVASLVAGALFVWSVRHRYRFGWNRVAARQLLRFGLPLAGASLIVFAVGYADQLAVGSILGSTALGFYVLAFNLSSWPVSMFSQPLRSVAPAAFARLQHDRHRMAAAFTTVLALIAGVTFPLCFLLSGAAEPVIDFVYGAEWGKAAAVLGLIGLLAIPRILFELAYDYLVVLGGTRAILTVQVIWLVALVPALVVGAHVGGLIGVGLAQLCVALLIVVPCYGFLLVRSGVGVRGLLSSLWAPACVGAASYVAASWIARVCSSPFAACLLAGLATMFFIGIYFFLRRDILRRFRGLKQEAAVA